MFEGPQPASIRLPEAAIAIGATYKGVRQWIDRYGKRGVRPSIKQTDPPFIEFSFGDVAALALTKYLVDIGMPAWLGFGLALGSIRSMWPELFDEKKPVWRINPDDPWILVLARDQSGEWITEEAAQRRAPVRITINAKMIVRQAFEKLIDMGHKIKIEELETTSS